MENFLAFETIYTPQPSPLEVTLVAKMSNPRVDEYAKVTCRLADDFQFISEITGTVRATTPLKITGIVNNTARQTTLNVTCWNKHTSTMSLALVKLEQAITGVRVRTNKAVSSIKEMVIVTISMQTGSHAWVAVNFGDLNITERYSPLASYKEPAVIRHLYVDPGEYVISVSVQNTFYVSEKLFTSVRVQNPIEQLVLSAPSIVQLSEEPTLMTLTHLGDAPPTNVTCNYRFSENVTRSGLAYKLMRGQPETIIYQYGLADAQKPVTFYVMCNNDVSTRRIEKEITVFEEIRGVVTTINRALIERGKQVQIEITIEKGSTISITVNWGDEDISIRTLPRNTTVGLLHSFKKVGVYAIRVTASNTGSKYNMSLPAIIVQERISSLVLIGNSSVSYPPGIGHFYLTLGDDQGDLQDIACNWDLGNIDKIYEMNVPEVTLLNPFHYQHQFSTASIGTLNIYVNCSNSISWAIAKREIFIERLSDDMLLFNAIFTPDFAPLNVTFVLSLKAPFLHSTNLTCSLVVDNQVLLDITGTAAPEQSLVIPYTFMNNDKTQVIPHVVCNTTRTTSTFTTVIPLVQEIVGLTSSCPNKVYGTGESVNLAVELQRGSNLTLSIVYGDGEAKSYHRSLLRNETFGHIYSTPGTYDVILQASNGHFIAATSCEGVVVAAPVKVIIESPSVIEYPSARATVVLKPRDVHMPPTNLSCIWNVTGNAMRMRHFIDLYGGKLHQESFTFDRDSIGHPIALVLKCWNLVNSQIISRELEVHERIEGLWVALSNHSQLRGASVIFSVSVTNGSTVKYSVSFGDGTTSLHSNPHTLASSAVFRINHTYSTLGNFTVIFTAVNPVSRQKIILPGQIIVQNSLRNLNFMADGTVLYPPGRYDVILKAGEQQEELHDVTCDFNFGQMVEKRFFFSILPQKSPFKITHTLKKPSPANVTTRVTCKNLINALTLVRMTEVVLDDTKLGSFGHKQIALINETLHFVLKIRRLGNNSSILIDFGDGKLVMYGSENEIRDANNENIEYRSLALNELELSLNHTYSSNGVYSVTVEGSNTVSRSTLLSYVTITAAHCEVPLVTMPLSVHGRKNPLAKKRSQFIEVIAEVQPDCVLAIGINAVSSIYSVVDGSETLLDNHISTNISKGYSSPLRYKITARVPPRSIPYGLARFQLAAWSQKIRATEIKTSFYVEIGQSNLDVRFEKYIDTFGSDRNETIRLIANDPDVGADETLVCKFYCRRHDEILPRKNGVLIDDVPKFADDIALKDRKDKGGCFYAGPGRMDVSDFSFNLDVSKMRPEMTYFIKAMCSKGDRSASAEKEIRVLKGKPPRINVM